jgi:hypothetical protein
MADTSLNSSSSPCFREIYESPESLSSRKSCPVSELLHFNRTKSPADCASSIEFGHSFMSGNATRTHPQAMHKIVVLQSVLQNLTIPYNPNKIRAFRKRRPHPSSVLQKGAQRVARGKTLNCLALLDPPWCAFSLLRLDPAPIYLRCHRLWLRRRRVTPFSI